MEKQTLPAEVRTTRGKGPARQLRMKGLIPAVLYGPGGETETISVDPVVLTKALTTPFRRNQLLELQIGERAQYAVLKELDVHPLSRAVRHADFYRVSLESTAVYEVPLHTSGRAKGVVKGGELRVLFRSLPLRVEPDKVPAEILINVENLDIQESVRVKDIPLEAGEIQLPADRALVTIISEQRKVVEEEAAAGAAAPAKAAKAGKK